MRHICITALALVLSACSGSGASGGRRGETTDASAALSACECALDWQIDNLALCVVRQTSFTAAAIYSSHLDATAMPQCDPARGVPQPVPLEPWSAHRIQSACAGTGRLCVALRHGSVENDGGLSSDCTVSEICADIDYATPGMPLELPPLAAWTAVDAECANRYDEGSGFFEFRLTSDQFSCGAENPTLVARRPSCPPGCDLEPEADRCRVCDLCPADCTEGSNEPRCLACGGSGNGAIARF